MSTLDDFTTETTTQATTEEDTESSLGEKLLTTQCKYCENNDDREDCESCEGMKNMVYLYEKTQEWFSAECAISREKEEAYEIERVAAGITIKFREPWTEDTVQHIADCLHDRFGYSNTHDVNLEITTKEAYNADYLIRMDGIGSSLRWI